MKTKKLFAAMLALCLLCACAVHSADNEIKNDDAEGEKEAITIALSSEPATLHPFDHSADVCGYMNRMTYNKLFITDIDTLEPVPELVESYTCSDDGLVWDFKLREGVLFHNGEEMTAADAVASLEYADRFSFCSRYIFWDSVEQTGDYTFRLTTTAPYSLALNDLTANSATVLPKSLIDSGNDFNLNPVGTGPYIFKEQSIGDSVTFTSNPNYFDKEHMPSIGEITWRVIPEGSSRTIGLETGEIDLVIDVEPSDVRRLEENPDTNVLSRQGTRVCFMVMNSQRAPFYNIDFRMGMNAAVDRQAVLDVAAGGMGNAVISPNPSAFPGSTDEEAIPYSPEMAREYFSASGVELEKLSLSCIVYNDETRRSAEVMQGTLAQEGITVNIESMDFAAFLTRMLDGDFDLAVAGYTSSNMLTYMRGLWHSASIGASNASRVVDPELDALIEQVERTLDPDARLELLYEICRRTNSMSLLVPLYTPSVVRAYSSRLGGLRVSPSFLIPYNELYIVK